MKKASPMLSKELQVLLTFLGSDEQQIGEEWKTIRVINDDGTMTIYDRWLVSNKGRVLSLCRNEPLIRKLEYDSDGYSYVKIGNKRLKVSRLVAFAFLKDTPEYEKYSNLQVHHKDCQIDNNSCDNLCWMTVKDHTKIHTEERHLKKDGEKP